MTSPEATERYGPLAIGLHCLTLVILIAVYACINLKGLFAKGSDLREAIKAWHFTLGMSILAVLVLRLLNRLRSRAPAVIPRCRSGTPGWPVLSTSCCMSSCWSCPFWPGSCSAPPASPFLSSARTFLPCCPQTGIALGN